MVRFVYAERLYSEKFKINNEEHPEKGYSEKEWKERCESLPEERREAALDKYDLIRALQDRVRDNQNYLSLKRAIIKLVEEIKREE